VLGDFLEKLAPIGLLEVHPTDVCNLKCAKCYYKRSDATFPLRSLPDVLAWARPKAIAIVGGGEPTLYSDPHSGADFADFVQTIKRCLPRAQIGLITNGVSVPPGDWLGLVDWLRVSVDAATRDTYRRVKGDDKFDQVISNLLVYLRSPVPHVGAGFLFNSINVAEATEFIAFMKRTLDSMAASVVEKFNIQFRPIRNRPWLEASGTAQPTRMQLCADSESIARVKEGLYNLRNDPAFEKFMDATSNWEKFFDAPAGESYFDRCYRALSFRLLRPNGDVYPCFAHTGNPQHRLGNVLESDFPKAAAVCSLCAIHFFNCNGAFCSPSHCPLSRENAICTEFFRGQGRSLSKAARTDFLFS
jgi:sulfatase maturation enzyme AslB (radical SAM superfamily)